MSSSNEVGAGKSIGHTTLPHVFQIVIQLFVACCLVSDLLCQGAKLVILDRHLLSEGILVLKMHLNFHCVATVEPGGKGPLFHPVVHLTQKDIGIALCCHIFSVELAHGKEALAHQSSIESVFQVITTSFITLRKLLPGATCLVEVEGLT